ncbi:ABC transporter ATP-binding protein [Prolixibacter sp. SD074]|uniref:ABC transporter ATP-binding protein n=1 Tax=Prolixibacter sp. SD074 TaxID=2652391 RepID=UPI001285D315|nr:ABC transporter ATP-binding protein [Prolixibacter sp. SD074]GET30346.1 ABC transporter ATP-binding protein [Prolixibacter sp. SD074]
MESQHNVIEIRDLYKSFWSGSSETEVLKGINLDIKSGNIIGYIGPNGAGKSTTVKILCGLITDFKGDIRMMGMDLRTEAMEIKKRIGYIPENASLYDSLTPLEFLSFLGEMRGMEPGKVAGRAMNLLRIFEMEKNANQRISTFSKGMRQKVLIISGMIHNPGIIFLDEPLSGLDANSVIMVKEVLTQLARDGKTIFYSSHLMDVVEKISNRIVLIDKGNVIADGTFDELKAQANDESLEKLFTRLTGSTGYSDRAEEFIHSVEK